VVEVAYHSIAIFRDHGYRKNRAHARLKFLVEDWGVEKFRQELEKRLGYRLEDSPADYQAPANAYRDHIGAYPQKDGRYAIGLATLGSRVTAEQLFALADLAEHYGSGHLRTTTLQNVVILDIPAEYVEEVKATAAAIGLPAETSNFRRGLMSCTGNQFCKQAVTETKNRAVSLIETLERELPNFPHQLSIGLNGCPNSCTRYQVADIGLVGSLGKPTNNPSAEKEEVFQIYLGGRLGDEAQLGHHLKQRVRAEEVQAYVVDLLKHFEAERSETETFTQYANRKFVTEK
jgi:sulfite reductase (ferredoxin)